MTEISQNSKLPVYKELQSFHWGGCKDRKTVHSGLTKAGGTKTYHPFFSDDQAFVKVVIAEMLDTFNVKRLLSVVIIAHRNTKAHNNYIICRQ